MGQPATEVMLGLYSMSRVLTLYEADNDAVGRLLEVMLEELRRFFAESEENLLTLRFLIDEFFVNGALLKVDAQTYLRGKEVSAILSRYNAGEVQFASGVDATDLEDFARAMGRCLRGEATVLSGSFGRIKVSRGQLGRSAAAFRFEPDQLAIWLYAGLMGVTEELYEAVISGQSPSLRPARRLIQLIIDNMADHSGIYQMLTVFCPLDAPPNKAQLRTAMCIDAIGMGATVGMSATEQMILGLSALLAGLAPASKTATEAVSPLFRLPGLGESAVPLVLTIADTRDARHGEPASLSGQILNVIEVYHHLTAIREPRLAPPLALKVLLAGRVPNVNKDVAALLSDFKGQVPIGSVVQLSNRQLGLVMSPGPSDAPQPAPRIGLLSQDRRLMDPIDLTAEDGLKIVRVFSIKQARLKLSQLLSTPPEEE